VERLVEAIVVNYNAGEQLERAVKSLIDDGIARVWIVDNASEDGSTSFVEDAEEKVLVVRPGKNLGYGRAANLGFEHTDSHYVIVCNPDIEVMRGAVSSLVNELEADQDCALVGPQIINFDGSTYPSVRHFPKLTDAAGHAILGQLFPGNPFTRRYRMLGVDHRGSFPADWVSGAFFLVRSDVFRKVGGFDERFFMYLEDVFLCKTIREHGYSVRFCGNAVVRHDQGLTTASRPVRMILAHHRSLWTYARLTKKGWRRLELLPIGAGIVVRTSISLWIAILGQRAKKPKLDRTK
jgi:N-acetylglucosaminyl-diphospho-decaprenol L-rhamnosyltransferase